jgi:hypothetical protein
MNRRNTCRTFYNPFAYNSNSAGSERLSANENAFLEIPPLWDSLFLFSFYYYYTKNFCKNQMGQI